MPVAQSEKQPKVAYRLELEKRIQINKSYSERRNQAAAMRILSYCLFGQKRYQNLYLGCSLNCFYYALKIANHMHEKVPGLAMLVKFQTSQVIQYYSESFEGKMFGQKSYSKIIIKLTKTPTEQDKKQPGFNPGLPVQQIQSPITQVIIRAQRKAATSSSYNNRGRDGRYNNNRGRGNYNNRQSYRGQRQNKSYEHKQQQGGAYQNNSYRDHQNNDKSDKKQYVEKNYGDDRDQRRIRRNRQEDLQQEKDNYQRSQPRTRGAPKYINNSRQGGYKNNNQRERQNHRDQRNYQQDSSHKATGNRPNYTQKNQKQNRGDRRPKRENRYNSDSD